MDLQGRINAIRKIEVWVQQGNPLPPSVKITGMDLGNNNQPQPEPFFFEPYRGPLPEPDPEDHYPSFKGIEGPFYKPIDWAGDINRCFQAYLATIRRETEIRIRFAQPGYFGRNLWEISDTSSWYISAYDRIPNETHVKCMMLNNVVGGDAITREELLCICRIMIKVLQTHKKHLVAPVMVISFMGPRHGRVLVAYHNGDSLVVGQSQLFDFRQENTDALKILARWWCSSSVGNTMTK